ncbi:hypothetical protein [Allomuricauda sp. SCSIO 65647]|uniref:hypothetical protein n=1 Tax=Allomuricauda sp. SCSIO 65647 TaxID=2908843 RepID=UPI001F287309|nr:hypothetical protein [Muricauda sp. SCSIO 65647]UJH67517.1 hypothetical protein L0P89_16405 [Muricauda sp. SCSIO 65647]
MRTSLLLFAMFFMVCINAFAQERNFDFPELSGPYLGQKPPGLSAEVFSSEIISTVEGREMCSAFTENAKEFYFNAIYDGTFSIFVTKEIDGKWTKPLPLHFSSAFIDRDFTISPDGRRIFFGSNRPRNKGESSLESLDIFFIQRKESGEWSNPVNLGPPVNSDFGENYPSVAANGNLYFFSCRQDGWGGCDLYLAPYEHKNYQEPILLNGNINSKMHDWDGYIAPDESYLIFSSKDRSDTLGTQDLYVSFKKEDNSWTKAKNLGIAVNSAYDEICPSITLDGKYLFFTSRRRGKEDIYWVSSKVIEELKPSELLSKD